MTAEGGVNRVATPRLTGSLNGIARSLFPPADSNGSEEVTGEGNGGAVTNPMTWLSSNAGGSIRKERNAKKNATKGTRGRVSGGADRGDGCAFKDAGSGLFDRPCRKKMAKDAGVDADASTPVSTTSR